MKMKENEMKKMNEIIQITEKFPYSLNFVQNKQKKQQNDVTDAVLTPTINAACKNSNS